MVKLILVLISISSLLFSSELHQNESLNAKINSFLDPSVYENNKAFINIIFTPKSNFYTNGTVDSVKVIQTLKDNGLLNLFFKSPKEISLSFKTNGTPLFFIKIMEDTLRNIGYYRYVTTKSSLNSSEFIWSISLNSEYATDPLVLQKELKKSGCNIIDVMRKSPTEWSYSIDMTNAYLNLQTLNPNVKTKLKRSLYSHWLDVSNIKKLIIKSSRRNNWYPYIAYYDNALHLLRVIKKDKKFYRLVLKIPPRAKYIKISDTYTLKNVKDSLSLIPLYSK